MVVELAALHSLVKLRPEAAPGKVPQGFAYHPYSHSHPRYSLLHSQPTFAAALVD
jgi:hypothetical protein